MSPRDVPFFGRSPSRRFAKVRGFTLVELLVVMAIVSMLVAMTAPMVASIAEGRAAYRAAEVISNAAAAARQTAITSGREIALVVSREIGFTKSQAVLLLAAPDSGGGGESWVPRGAWTKLPSAVLLEIFRRDGAESFYGQADGILPTELPVKLDGKAVADYAFIVFHADGTVSAPAAGPAVTLRRSNKTGGAPDYTVVVQSDSGRARMIANR